MFSMFGRTGAPTKRGPHKRHKIFHAAIVVCIAARVLENVDDDYCACRVKAVGGGGYSYIRGPTFFLNRGPARSKSGPDVRPYVREYRGLGFFIFGRAT